LILRNAVGGGVMIVGLLYYHLIRTTFQNMIVIEKRVHLIILQLQRNDVPLRNLAWYRVRVSKHTCHF